MVSYRYLLFITLVFAQLGQLSVAKAELGFLPESLAPGIRLRPDAGKSAHRVDANGLPALPLQEDIKYRATEITSTLGTCACSTDPFARAAGSKPLGQTSVRDVNGRRFAISVVSFDLALRIFQALEKDVRAKASTLNDGCHARAHEASYRLEKKGILTGKIMASGHFQVLNDNLPKRKVDWLFHVAPFVVIDEGEKRGIWVLDPALFSEPVPIENWLSLLMQHPRAKLKEVYVTNRFTFHPGHKDLKLTKWRKVDFKSAKLALQKNLRNQKRFAGAPSNQKAQRTP